MIRHVLATATMLAIGVSPASSAPQLREPCDIVMEGTFSNDVGTSHFNYIKPANFESVPSQLVGFASTQRGSTSATVMAIPLNEADYRSVFETQTVSSQNAREISEAKALFGGNTQTATAGVADRKQFRDYLKNQSGARYVIVAGHNADGVFRFSKEAVEIPLLAEDCARAEKICIFISCRSNDYLSDGSMGVSRDLTLAEGVYLSNALAEWLRLQTHGVSELDVATYLRNLQRKANFKYHVSYLAFAACKVAGTAAVIFLLIEGAECASGQKKCPWQTSG